MCEYTIEISPNTVWTVRAYGFTSDEESAKVFEELMGKAESSDSSFSLWRSRTPASDVYVVILCGKVADLPEVDAPVCDIGEETAYALARRRAIRALEALSRGEERCDEYNDFRGIPVVLTRSGELEPWTGEGR